MLEITEKNFKDVLTNDFVLIDFWAPWCRPCVEFSSTFEAISDELEGTVVCGKVNIDDYPGIASNYAIQSIPTILLFKKGSLVERIVGRETQSKIVNIVQRRISESV